jgi:hypothetical protein
LAAQANDKNRSQEKIFPKEYPPRFVAIPKVKVKEDPSLEKIARFIAGICKEGKADG